MCYSAGMGEKIMGYRDSDHEHASRGFRALCWGLGLLAAWIALGVVVL